MISPLGKVNGKPRLPVFRTNKGTTHPHQIAKNLFFFKSAGNLVVTVLACIMVQWAIRYFQWSIRSWERSPALMIPMVYAQFSLVVSSFLMAFYFLVEFLDNARQFFGKPPFALPDDEAGFACLAATGEQKEGR